MLDSSIILYITYKKLHLLLQLVCMVLGISVKQLDVTVVT